MKGIVGSLQQLGRALMLPIAVLPAAGMLLRLGQPDLLNIAFMAAAGQAVFANLGLIFAIGVAIGFARENNGTAGLAGAICFLVISNSAQALIAVPATLKNGVPASAIIAVIGAYKTGALAQLSVPLGIISGCVGGFAYNRFSGVELPSYLAFFGGRRFVPIVSAGIALVIGMAVGLTVDRINYGVDVMSRAVLGSGEIGLFIYGVLNCLLRVTGLHHIINNIAWFVVGDYHGKTGDLARFYAGDPTAGSFMAGFYPVMMFGLPAACFAMYRAALPERRAEVGGMFLSAALTVFLTGVTEPVEFMFLFVAPILFAIHATLTGISMVLLDVMHIKLGFGFSAGLFDYLINFNISTNPLLMLPVGFAYAIIYYGVFSYAIKKFDLKTPGRDANEVTVTDDTANPVGARADRFITALGGAQNLLSIDACLTRLRLRINDQALINERALRALGAKAVIYPSADAVQIVLGQEADAVAGEMRVAARTQRQLSNQVGSPTRSDSNSEMPVPAEEQNSWKNALGGIANLLQVRSIGGRLVVEVSDARLLDTRALTQLCPRGMTQATSGRIHLLLGTRSKLLAAAIESWRQ
jgi:N-acetylglucosamine PTS system EIICBA or EIICB component